MWRTFAFVLAAGWIAACDPAPMPMSMSMADASGPPCTTDVDCDDDRFCNGVERCIPAASGADGRGCITPVRPCLPTQACHEETERCESLCALAADADDDGADSLECGGDDCDDGNPRRFPGNAEVCDLDDADEDCEPTTFGDADFDGDGFVSARCCNGTTCGDDCDDSQAGVHRTAPEVCNGRDDDCDGPIDEEVRTTFYRDFDGDLYGDAADTTEDCSVPRGYTISAGDCDDHAPTVHPGLFEICDGLDNDCSGEPDGPGEDDDDDDVISVACGGLDCEDEIASVLPGATETCDGYDTDCNGMLDGPSEDVDDDGAPSCGPGPLDCIDTEARTGICTAPLGCQSPVCGCTVTLPFTYGGLDLDIGRVFGTSATGDVSGIDVRTQSALPIGNLAVLNTARHQLAAGHDWWSVTPGVATMLGSMTSSIPMNATEIYLVESTRGFLYRVGYATRVGSGARFFYAPVGPVYGGFACPP